MFKGYKNVSFLSIVYQIFVMKTKLSKNKNENFMQELLFIKKHLISDKSPL
jgi:hypothetical protein